ncbi:hypothetical protein [Streptomyces lucensis]|uniref:hypothetical protein n=1 Tax=Streptomyces lucensis TaxID=67319 RepID=UPI001E5F37A3|nr:hypothetical protein [Streptomyces lucensis]
MIAVAAAAAAAVVSALVTAGVTGGAEAKPAPTVTVTKTAAADDEDVTPADDESTPAPETSDDGIYALDDTVVYDDSDVEVGLSGFKRAVTGEFGEPENASYLGFTIKLKNAGSKTFDPTALTVNCSYGRDGKSSEAVFDSDAGLEGGPETRLLAGRSLNVPWGCELPKGEKLIQIEVTPDFDSEASVFTGKVR